MHSSYLFLLVVASFLLSVLTESFELSVLKNATLLQGKIVLGQPASRHQFPYQISYQLNGRHICGGSILTQNWIVTAGHCIVGSPNNTVVVAGMLNQGEQHPDVQRAKVSNQFVHPKYPGGVAANDIALLQLASPLVYSEAVQPIRLPADNQEFELSAWISGWGYLRSSVPVTPIRLQYIRLFIHSLGDCRNNLIKLTGTSEPLDETMICFVGYNTPCEGVCQGDSGGPAVQDGILLGVASWTLSPCGTCTAPSVYTKMSKHLDFIREHIPDV